MTSNAGGAPGQPAWRRRAPSRMLWPENHESTLPGRPLKLLSFNIQAGIRTERYREYVTRGWRQFVHDPGRQANLQRIAHVLAEHDIIALQEVDAGSLRSGFVNQVASLAHLAGHRHWYAQRNRRYGRFAQHGNGIVSRFSPLAIEDHPLPSAIPGRGAIFAEYGVGDEAILVAVVHLSLGFRARRTQLAYLAERLAGHPRVVLMGDMNAGTDTLLGPRSPLKALDLRPAHADDDHATWPSWSPREGLDHVFLSPDLELLEAETLPLPYSDHLPVAVEIALR